MKNKNTLKKYFIAGMAASTLGLANFAFADTAPSVAPGALGQVGGSALIVAAIHDLSNTVQNIAAAAQASQNGDKYQPTPGQTTVAQVNNDKAQAQVSQYPNVQGVGAITRQKTANVTDHQNKNSLTEFSDAALTYTNQSEDVQAAQERIKARNTIIDQLSWQTKASDSLYTDLSTASADLQKPNTLHDNYFNFSSIIQPVSYTSDQKDAAEKFITYLSQRYQSLSDSINFGKLRAHLMSLQNKPQQLQADFKSFVTSASYEQYQLAARTIITERSVALDNLNQLVAERSPITTPQRNANLEQLSKAIGVNPSTQKDPKTGNTVYVYASPLQISNYVTTHRTSDPTWYQQMMAAPSPTVQRETLFVMAEVETELQRQHLDNERILATLTAMQMQNVTSQETGLKALANDLNQQIATLSGSTQATGMTRPGSGNSVPSSMNPAGK